MKCMEERFPAEALIWKYILTRDSDGWKPEMAYPLGLIPNSLSWLDSSRDIYCQSIYSQKTRQDKAPRIPLWCDDEIVSYPPLSFSMSCNPPWSPKRLSSPPSFVLTLAQSRLRIYLGSCNASIVSVVTNGIQARTIDLTNLKWKKSGIGPMIMLICPLRDIFSL